MSSASIMIVEDEPEIRDLMESFLTEKGCFVASCNDGTEAVDAFNSMSFDVIILDVNLPRLNGFELLNLFRQSKRGKDTRVIVISGKFSQLELDSKIRSFDNVSSLQKPFEMADLRLLLSDFLVAEDELTVDPDDLKKATLVGPNTDLFSQATFSELENEHWELYELTIAEHSYCAAVPQGLDPTHLKELSGQALKHQVLLWRKVRSGFIRVWPED